MDILVITWNFPPRRGGIETLMSNLCHGLKKSHEPYVITSFASSADRDEDWLARPRMAGLLPFFIYALFYGAFLLWRFRRIEVILGGSALVVPLVLLLARLFRRKAVVNVHGSDLIYPSIVYQVLCVRWIRHCDRIVANSRYTASLAEGKKVKNSSICVIPPSVDWTLFAPLRDGNGKPKEEKGKREMGLDGRKVLLCVGRLARRKGIVEFLERALSGIEAKVPQVCLLIVGDNPTDSLIHHDDVLAELKALVRNLGWQDRVRFLSGLSDKDLAELYRLSDLVVLPALPTRGDVEGFGIVILEAAAAGKPCVATRVGGIPEAIEDGKSGVLVEPEDYPSIVEAVVGLLQDDRRRLAMGEYSQKRVRKGFALEVIVERYEALFRSLA